MSSEEPRGRPKLNLKPRDEAAAAKAADERSKAAKSNPFGQAKPRESILATRTGKKEEDILRDELLKEKLKLRYTPEQNEKKQAAEAEVSDLEEAIGLEEDEEKKTGLKTDLDKKKLDLVALLSGFEKLAIEMAKSGEGVRPSERRRLAEEREREQGGGSAAGGGGYGGQQAPSRGNYGSGDYSYGPGGGGGGRGGRQGGGFGGSRGFEDASGKGGFGDGYSKGGGGYNEPLAQNYDRGFPATGGGAGANDMFAGGSGQEGGGGGGSYSRGQDRF